MFKTASSQFLEQKNISSTDPNTLNSGIKRNPHPLFVPVVSRSEIGNKKTIPTQRPLHTQPQEDAQPYVFPELPRPATLRGWKLVLEEQPNHQYVPALKYMPIISRSQSFYEDITMEDSTNRDSFVKPSLFQSVSSQDQPGLSPSLSIVSSQHPLSSFNSSSTNSITNTNTSTNNNNLISEQESGNKNNTNYPYSPKLKPFFTTRDSRPKDTRRSFVESANGQRRPASMAFEYTERTDSEDSNDVWSQLGEKRQVEQVEGTDRRVLPKTISNENTEMFTLPSHPAQKDTEQLRNNELGPHTIA
ncbi:hypothetical protein CLU79DRAFT_733554 [Phycomyces nitens]|nr:hypothetical protein CLU79DRAFT_733554 [Phycomyces nitens]